MPAMDVKPAAPLPLLVVTTVATRDDAFALARDLVEQRLAACAQIEPIESIYRWNGTVQHDSEVRVLFKTAATRYAEVEAAIRRRHPYALPAIHAIATSAADAAYAAWVDQETSRDGPS